MKKKILIGSAIILGVIALLGVVLYITGPKILFSQVDRVEFRGHRSCDGPSSKTVVLSDSEAFAATVLCNTRLYWGSINADFCVSDYSFTFYLEDGNRVSLTEVDSPRIKTNATTGRSRYWIVNPPLAILARLLILKYDLTI